MKSGRLGWNWILYKNVKESLVSEDRVLEFDLVIWFSLIHIKICFNWNKLSIIDKSNWEDILSHIIYNEKNIPWLKIDKVIDKQVDFNY